MTRKTPSAVIGPSAVYALPRVPSLGISVMKYERWKWYPPHWAAKGPAGIRAYRKGCRCIDCTEANRVNQADYRARVKVQQTSKESDPLLAGLESAGTPGALSYSPK